MRLVLHRAAPRHNQLNIRAHSLFEAGPAYAASVRLANKLAIPYTSMMIPKCGSANASLAKERLLLFALGGRCSSRDACAPANARRQGVLQRIRGRCDGTGTLVLGWTRERQTCPS